jgi:hypothetical protein
MRRRTAAIRFLRDATAAAERPDVTSQPPKSTDRSNRRPDVQANSIAQADTAGKARLEPAAPFSIAESMARRAW